MNNPQQKNQIYDWFLTWAFRNGEMCRLAGVAKKALRGDNPGTPLAKNPFGGDDDRGRFAKGPEKAQVTDGLFSSEEIIHFAIVTAGALFGHVSSLPRPFWPAPFRIRRRGATFWPYWPKTPSTVTALDAGSRAASPPWPATPSLRREPPAP